MKRKPTQLMKDCGSKTGRWSPEPEDHTEYGMRKGSEFQRVVCWVRKATTDLDRSSPYAVNEHGTELHVEDLARDLGWAVRTAHNVLNECAKEGLVRVDELRRIWLCADVPAAYISETACGKQDSVQSPRAGYVADFIRSLPAKKRPLFEAKYDTYLEVWRPRLYREGMAKLRSIDEQVEDTIFREFGGEKKRLRKRRVEEDGLIEVRILKPLDSVQGPDFVQTQNESVQTGFNGSYKPKTAGASLLSSESESDKRESATVTPLSRIGTEGAAAAAPALQVEKKAPPTYGEFRALYPKEKLDDAKACEAFKALPSFDKKFCLEGLKAHLICERWMRSATDDKCFYIPLASNFIRRGEYSHDPPPYVGGPRPDERENRRAKENADRARKAFTRAMEGRSE